MDKIFVSERLSNFIDSIDPEVLDTANLGNAEIEYFVEELIRRGVGDEGSDLTTENRIRFLEVMVASLLAIAREIECLDS